MSNNSRQGLSVSSPTSYPFGCVGDSPVGGCIFVGLLKWALIIAALKEAEMLQLPKVYFLVA